MQINLLSRLGLLDLGTQHRIQVGDSDTSDVEIVETAGTENETDCLQLTFQEKSVTQVKISTIPDQGVTKMKQRRILDYFKK